MPGLHESDFENVVLSLLREMDYAGPSGASFDPDAAGAGGPGLREDPSDYRAGPAAERENYHATILVGRFRAAVARINPTLPPEAVEAAVNAVLDVGFPELVQENRRIHRLLVDGVPVEYLRGGETIHDRAKLIDWKDVRNDWLAVPQFTVVGTSRRRPDVVIFLNGLPLVVIELKGPEAPNADIRSAFNQIQTYKSEIPALFRTNLLSVVSDGHAARYGTISADFDRFMAWRTVDGETLVEPHSALAWETLVKGLLRRDVLLDLLRYFTVFEQERGSVIKKTAGYHQFHAGRKGLAEVLRALRSDGRAGVVWHTQGSGKSLLMAFFGGMLVHHEDLGNPTLVVLTDRNDLDNQLFATFSRCAELFGQAPKQVSEVAELRKLLDVQAGGVIFATIQKFRPEDGEFPTITERKNVVVFVDEAHRSQYGFNATIDVASGEVSYGFAHYVRKGLPNATFVGFTGTPVEMVDKNTKQVFGDYIDIYDITQAVEDGATVPIYYEGKIVRLNLDEKTREAIDASFDEVTEGMEDHEKARMGGKWSTLEALAGASDRLDELASLIVEHFEKGREAIEGKGMIVCMSRRICVELHDRIANLRPDWHDPADDKGRMKVVMTGSAADPPSFQPHVRTKKGMTDIANRFRDPADDFQLVIVRDMWLTGFDCPSMHTLYIDKPMHGHNLMQAIARVNRIFMGKPSGLVVDTIGIATDLKEALSFYSDRDRGNIGIDTDEAVKALEQYLDVLRSMFHGFDYTPALGDDPAARLRTVGFALDHVYGLEGEGEDAKKKARQRFLDAVAGLEKAFKLASGRDEAAAVALEVAFFCAVKIAMKKFEGGEGGGFRGQDLDAAIERLVSQSVSSIEVIDLLSVAGIRSPDISVLSEEFLREMSDVEHKNLAVEALRKLLQGEVTSRTRTNVVKSRQFSERIEEAMARYHNRVIDALQVIEELIRLARDLREEPEDGLTAEEASFYDALADNQSAIELMGNEDLRLIASELVRTVRDNAGFDWWKFDNRRKRIRVAVKRILKKYGYPPDLQDAAIKTVVEQAEALAAQVR
jgi:type I restriction enzyme R subunit